MASQEPFEDLWSSDSEAVEGFEPRRYRYVEAASSVVERKRLKRPVVASEELEGWGKWEEERHCEVKVKARFKEL